ncbi:MAG: DUF1592 domain-containing protein, partial [Myxococcota bacterium]
MLQPRRLAAALALLAGCQGDIADMDSDFVAPPEIPVEQICEDVVRSPGRVTVRRLNAAEYDRTVQALFDLDESVRSSGDFPIDDESAQGFLNNADVLSTGALHVEKYASAAQDLADAHVDTDAFRARYTCTEFACLRSFVEDFGLHAWRRPLVADEIARIENIARMAEGGAFVEGQKLAVRAMLLSPNFIFISEPHTGGDRALNDYEVASRLSYFLWGGPPDDTLYAAAEAGELLQRDALRREISRMIDDARFAGFFDGFVHRWLTTQHLPLHVVDAESFPQWDEDLYESMTQEVELLVAAIIRDELPIETLLTADFTFLNGRLSEHYGIGDVDGEEFVRVDLTGTPRGGLLTTGAFLSVTSHPRFTSPVTRGKFVLDRLLCDPPPAAPADVTPETHPEEGQSRREALEEHRTNPECAGCHSRMDPPGFALENFDAIGQWRETEDGTPDGHVVDASAILSSGVPIDGARSLGAALSEDTRFEGCITENLLSYAIGRSLSGADSCLVLDLVDADSG